MSTVHGAMLTARALGDPDAFQTIVRVAIHRLAA
jgi:TetR/AcrR family transcriptional repressor of nem operon